LGTEKAGAWDGKVNLKLIVAVFVVSLRKQAFEFAVLKINRLICIHKLLSKQTP
jgi:hypothetical protein